MDDVPFRLWDEWLILMLHTSLGKSPFKDMSITHEQLLTRIELNMVYPFH